MPAPVLTGPTNQTATQGDAATFSVSATGDSPFTYQWYETTAGYLLDEGTDTLVIATVLADNGNSYYCVVTDTNGLFTQSSTATLTVSPASTIAPVIIGPEDKTVNAGDVVSFNVTASGSGPFAYQWYLATGGIISGETGRTLTFTAKPVDNGRGYKCVVSDVSGLVNSSRTASLEVLGASLPGNADIDYPCHLPGVLVNSNGYQSSERTRPNDLSSGPPLFVLEDDDGYEMFDVAWSFDAAQIQSFRNWYRFITASGSRLFNIELWIDGYDGIKQTRTHECYFLGTPHPVQNGRKWHVSATLVAIEEKGTDECLYVGPPLDLSGVFPEVGVLEYACNAFEQELYAVNGAGFIWDAYSLVDPLSITSTTSLEHNGKQALHVGMLSNSMSVAARGVLGSNSCPGSTCLRPDNGAASPVIEFDNTGGGYAEGDGYIRGGLLIDTTDQSVNIATNISLAIGMLNNGVDGGWWGSTEVKWDSTYLYLGGTGLPWSGYPQITQPGPMWLDVEFHYYHGPGFEMRIVITAYVNGHLIGSIDFLESSPGGGPWTWSPATELRMRWAGGLTDDTYVSNLYSSTDTLASWIADGRLARLKLAYERNFIGYTP
ncbi:MAG: immunoglobulin domain-containing protein [Desulfuromonadales bacterium]|nr:immunoglobulin domain-containing protein [Desulfuromonadales bacterium]